MADLITTDKIQYYLKTGDSTYVRVTEDLVFDPADEPQTYAPSYKDRLNQPEYITGHKISIPFEIDMLDPGDLQEFLLANEDGTNIATEVIRVLMFRPALPEWAASTEYSLGDKVIASDKVYECTTAGTSGTEAPTWPASGTVTDGTTLVWTYVSSSTGYVIGTAGYSAKKAAFNLNQNPLDGASGEAVRATGTLRMTDDGWTEGTFDTSSKTFTPVA